MTKSCMLHISHVIRTSIKLAPLTAVLEAAYEAIEKKIKEVQVLQMI